MFFSIIFSAHSTMGALVRLPSRVRIVKIALFVNSTILCNHLNKNAGRGVNPQGPVPVFNIPVAKIEAVVKPDSVRDDVRRESMAFVGSHGPSLAISARNLSVPPMG